MEAQVPAKGSQVEGGGGNTTDPSTPTSPCANGRCRPGSQMCGDLGNQLYDEGSTMPSSPSSNQASNSQCRRCKRTAAMSTQGNQGDDYSNTTPSSRLTNPPPIWQGRHDNRSAA
jgi:hypothetical protein